MSYWAIRHFHILHILYNFVRFGGISLIGTLCDAYYEEDESECQHTTICRLETACQLLKCLSPLNRYFQNQLYVH